MFDYPCPLIQQIGKFFNISNWSEIGIQNQIVLIGSKKTSSVADANGYPSSQRS